MKLKNKNSFILASGSPRRSALLKEMGFSFEIQKPEINEAVLKNENPKSFVRRLSLEKASKVFEANSSSVVLAADTCVYLPKSKKILNKPLNKKEAAQMLASLSGKEHHVYTGYTLLAPQRRPLTQVVQTKVIFNSLSRPQILNYIETLEPMDKAGSYAAQGIGASFILSIIGSYTNVVGLPLAEVSQDLKKFKIYPLWDKP